MRSLLTIIITILFCFVNLMTKAQEPPTGTIIIGGKVYGGGNKGDTGGNSTVNIYSGDIHQVYGGACQANVGGRAFLNIDGEHASKYIIIDKAYGGNDISGTIGTFPVIPDTLTKAEENLIDNQWNVFVRTSTKLNPETGEAADDAQPLYIGQLFAGGNGDYNYSAKKENGLYDVTIDEEVIEDVNKPDVSRTYLELMGGSIDYAYGGGNNVTVTDSTKIYYDNPSAVTASVLDDSGTELLTETRCRERMGLNMAFSFPNSDAFQVGCFYGGNNKAEMHTRPMWNLKAGAIRNLYGGGNRGAMTCPEGLLLEIRADATLKVDNLYGGCRMADVRPSVNGVYTPVDNLPGYKFPKGLSARVLVRGGDINNVYGGNDITGRVYGGSAIGIYTTVRGDVYGGGNGSYAYTDNVKLAEDEAYGDLYYGSGFATPAENIEALNNFRPNAEQVSIRLDGSLEKTTYIGGSVYCGGNSASLKTTKLEPMVELKIGSYVVADKVFLGNNGANMIKYNAKDKSIAGTDSIGAAEGVLYTMQRTDIEALEGTKFSSLDLTNADQFAAYMQGAAMPLVPSVVFDSKAKGDPEDYVPFSTNVGSFYLGGNVGSMTAPGTFTMDELNSIIIYDKFVGGCNDAYVPAVSGFNAEHMGGVTIAPAVGKPKIDMNFIGLRLKPMILQRDLEGKPTTLTWHTNGETGDDKRLIGGNIYGGCYNSGYINGNILINLDHSTVDKEEVFGEGASGVDPTIQRDELRFTSMGIFGGGYGVNSEVWGSTTINVKNGYHFNIYGGGEKGAVGKKSAGVYSYDDDYSTYVNLMGSVPGAATGDMTEAEYLYGGGFEGLVAGDTHVTLGNGRVNSTFGGASNADILGHTETIIGSGGFPYIIDDVYGGNDLGGTISGTADLTSKASTTYSTAAATASTYVEYLQGRVDEIFGGCFGGYYYEKIDDGAGGYKSTVLAHLLNCDETKEVDKPYLNNAFVHIRPDRNPDSKVNKVFGAGLGNTRGAVPLGDILQDRSYVLIDIPGGFDKLKDLEVFGAGSYNGLGMGITRSASNLAPESATAIIDLRSGEINAAYGASYNEGITRRTLVNVPSGSTIVANSIFGGAYGTDQSNAKPCDAFEANVNYASNDATIKHAIYGGNNNARRTFFGKVNISNTVWSDRDKGYQATVYGAGYGRDTWSQYTEVNLEDGANVYEAYGGGEMGLVINVPTINLWKAAFDDSAVRFYLPEGYSDDGLSDNLANSNMLHTREPLRPEKYNTNVHIKQGATVGSYCYGGGLGYTNSANSGNVYGTTYIDLLGGKVVKDLYAAGTTGSVKDSLNAGFTASATAYIEGGTARNVYGGGWKGSVGHHDGDISASSAGDRLGETHVVIGIREDQASVPEDYGYYVGVPAIQRNAYGGGEGGAVFGTTNVTLNNGFVGYVYSATEPESGPASMNKYSGWYQEKLHDETWTDHVGENRLLGSGNVFGGGYIDNSSVDYTNVTMWNGYVRNSLFGGGEIAAIGRGIVRIKEGSYQNSERELVGKYKVNGELGKTHIEMYNGHVLRDVFAGGKGYNNLGEVGTLYTDGYVFGQTEAYIYGGEIGTATNYTKGYGNVFGGGDLGYVYGKGEKCEDADYRPSPNHYYYTEDGTKEGDKWTEDCKVVVEATAQVKAGQTVTIDGKTYTQYQYVPLEDLNKLKGKNDATDGAVWAKLDDKGIIIRNAVFGGGNVADGSDKVYANTKTVFGNVTASLRDVYRRDLITIGTEHTGGLYGGGNLSLVDGYRELHISNYGTDYYNLSSTVTKDQYDNDLTDRERAYFRLRYTCKQNVPSRTIDGVTYRGYNEGQQIYEDEYKELYSDYQNSTYWTEDGVCSIYSGRLLNTLQRADLVGVFGSRMVLQGARDRVTDVQDNTNYTINRVGELSLKKVVSPAGETDELNKEHGNYFGIYSVVNYLGNLTSDVLMTDTRETDSGDADPEHPKSYHDWKAANPNSRKRNTATCHNQVALASGVFLELVNEPTGKVTKSGKEYGFITGVVELDLINAKADAIGGGYVYAKNEHGKREEVEYKRVRLSDFNRPTGDDDEGLRTYKMYKYNESILEDIQTSGNFIHGKAKTIIDDCYPNNLEYDHTHANFSEAHYWYIKGSIYIYDQVISAYTGAPTAYSRSKHIPLTITAGSHGKLQLLDVKPNKYAYYNKSGDPLGSDEEVKVNNNSVTYKLNDVITYWDWSQLSKDEQDLFVDETWVCIADGTVGSTTYTKGDVFDSEPASPAPGTIIKDAEGNTCEFTDIIRPTNNISHNTGYVLDFKMDTPPAWSRWYSSKTGDDKIDSLTYNKPGTVKADYVPGPTYSTDGGVYGQRNYSVGEIITSDVVTEYNKIGESEKPADQAVVELAYVAKEAVTYTYNNGVKEVSKSVSKGTAIPKTEYDALATQAPSAHTKFAAAKMCVNTLRLNEETYLVYGDLFTADSIDALKSEFDAMATVIGNSFTDAYICSSEGLYGGKSYSSSEKYSALEGWASLTSADRAKNKFRFNYDAFDVLIDPTYSGKTVYGTPYDKEQNVEYVAIYKGTAPLDVSYVDADKDGTPDGLGTIKTDSLLTRLQYEALTNEKANYTPIVVPANMVGSEDIYIVTSNDPVSLGSMVYTKGQIIPTSTYLALQEKDKVSKVTVSNSTYEAVTYYYCHTGHTCKNDVTVTNRKNDSDVIDSATTNGSLRSVSAGWVIDHTDYGKLVNDQKDFIIKGNEPTETTTLYVSRESDIRDLSKDKVITVIYQYTYNESDDNGDVTPVNEMHIVNIHLDFESGAPIIDRLMAPTTVLPGTTVGMNQPRVTPGAYELIGGGWEIFDSKYNAEHHTNGQEYVNNSTPMYYYQDGYYVAYYAKSYLGKTYSNPVQFSVANYHDLKAVLEADHHYYIDHKDAHKDDKRIPKVYINDYSAEDKNGLDLLKDFYDLTRGDAGAETTYGAFSTPEYISGAADLDFILRTNLDHSESSWTPIGDETVCFGGNVHGDGHYVSGLNNSLFGKLCGNVYNLGVQGTFTGGGIADSGSGIAENCWVKTTGTPTVKAIIGDPDNNNQIKNCYYPVTNAFTSGAAIAKTEKEFNNGLVAYNLNRFYLQKRYNVNRDEAAAITDTAYVYSRYGNVDFIYADGTIPEEVNEAREDINPETGERRKDPLTGEPLYVPLYPDDYIFFGQKLTYGYIDGQAHQDVPSPLVKNGEYIETGVTGNRVLRAPAYFRNSTISTAYFNPYAVFAKHMKDDETFEIHKNMTAIDFTGYNDVFNGSTGASIAYHNDIANTNPDDTYFKPLLDAGGLSNFFNYGLTRNLLAYTEPAETGESATPAGKTGQAVKQALEEYNMEVTNASTYKTVAPKVETMVSGHWVERVDGTTGYKAHYDQFLVDRNDFYAPMAYTFDGNHIMWHQRTPDNFTSLKTGWESISLPFTVEMVTTQDKGELTHFYSTSKVGHEYWLREYKAIDDTTEPSTIRATFSSLVADDDADTKKEYTNTFLWDYYHSTNTARSQEGNDYYREGHDYVKYPLQQAATPYIIGFPGKRFYEFDLSGEWTTSHVNEPKPMQLDKQVVTFASLPNITINKSDDDMRTGGVEHNSYTFKVNYLNENIAAGSDTYLMATDGSKYQKVTEATPLLPFRAYFVRTGGSNSMNIIFSEAEGNPDATVDDKGIDDKEPSNVTEGTLVFTAGSGTITAKSTLKDARVVLVYGAGGALVKAFDLKQNSSVTIHVPSGLVYAVRTVSGDYSSKLFVR